MANGFSRIKRIDFQKVNFLFLRYATVHLAMLVSVRQKNKRRLLDVKNAVVTAGVKELIYVIQPDRFVQVGKKDWVYVLRGALYGLPQ